MEKASDIPGLLFWVCSMWTPTERATVRFSCCCPSTMNSRQTRQQEGSWLCVSVAINSSTDVGCSALLLLLLLLLLLYNAHLVNQSINRSKCRSVSVRSCTMDSRQTKNSKDHGCVCVAINSSTNVECICFVVAAAVVVQCSPCQSINRSIKVPIGFSQVVDHEFSSNYKTEKGRDYVYVAINSSTNVGCICFVVAATVVVQCSPCRSVNRLRRRSVSCRSRSPASLSCSQSCRCSQ